MYISRKTGSDMPQRRSEDDEAEMRIWIKLQGVQFSIPFFSNGKHLAKGFQDPEMSQLDTEPSITTEVAVDFDFVFIRKCSRGCEEKCVW